jgi:hypothetical protein
MDGDIPVSDKARVDRFDAWRPSRGSAGCFQAGALHVMIEDR